MNQMKQLGTSFEEFPVFRHYHYIMEKGQKFPVFFRSFEGLAKKFYGIIVENSTLRRFLEINLQKGLTIRCKYENVPRDKDNMEAIAVKPSERGTND